MTAPAPASWEEDGTICPRCGLAVSFKWATGERGGFISEPHNALIADAVYHAECWDALVAEHPPGDPADTVGLSDISAAKEDL